MSLDVHLTVVQPSLVFTGNITHNLANMADKAGLYKALWRPEELGIKKAEDLIPILRDGISVLKRDPEYFKRFNAVNGWGTYEHLLNFVDSYLRACEENPAADVSVSR